MSLIEPLQAADEEALAEGIAQSSRPGFVRTAILGNRPALVGLAILAFFIFVAVFAPFLEPYDPTAKTGPVYEPPSSAHWLGTDDGGGDMLSLVIAGSRGFAGCRLHRRARRDRDRRHRRCALRASSEARPTPC